MISLMADIRTKSWMGVANLTIKCTPEPLLRCTADNTLSLLTLGKKVRLAVKSLGSTKSIYHSNDVRKVFLSDALEPLEGVVLLTIL